MIKHLEINTQKVKQTTKLLLISDLHQTLNSKHDNLTKLKKELQEEFKSIDYILITGDIIDNGIYLKNKSFCNQFIDSMKKFTEGKKTYYVLGNHDITIKERNNQTETKKIEELLGKLNNFYYLKNNELFKINNISLLGFNPNLYYYLESRGSKEEFQKQFEENNSQEFPKNTFNIFLTHDPSSIIELSKDKNKCIKNNTDLVISGHMHDGLMPSILQKITNHHGIVGPYNTKFPKYSHGIVDIDNTKYIILGPVNTYIKSKTINKVYSPKAYILTINPTKKIVK